MTVCSRSLNDCYITETPYGGPTDISEVPTRDYETNDNVK